VTVISPQPVKAILFDMDGVIVNSEPLHHRAYHMMFAEVGIEVSAARYSSFTGQATLPICQRLCAEYGLAEKAETLVALKRKHFKDLFENDNDFDLIPGVLELIKQYHAKGLVLILASSASMPNINRIFDRFERSRFNSFETTSGDIH
jgi:beta-phosphoglucomutase